MIIECKFAVQDENYNDWQRNIRVARYEDNLSVVEAYSDPRLQPVVAMKRLSESQ